MSMFQGTTNDTLLLHSLHLQIHLDQIHLDLVGSLPPSNGYTYLLTCIDRFSHWPGDTSCNWDLLVYELQPITRLPMDSSNIFIISSKLPLSPILIPIHGLILCLHGQFFSSSTKDHTVPDTSDYVTQLKSFMQQLQATPTHAHSNRPTHNSDDLSLSSYVFVHHDSIRKLLQQPYDGPFKILKRTDKHFTVDIKGQQEVISVDRLKPAHLEVTLTTQPDTQPSPPLFILSGREAPKGTCSGRYVHWPDRLNL